MEITSKPVTLNLSYALDADILFHRVAQYDDQSAFEKLFRLLYKSLLATALPIIGSQQLAEEIVSDVFCSLWKNRKVIQVHSSFKAYVFTSIRNKSLDYLRKVNREKTIDLANATHIPYPEDTIEQRLDQEKLALRVERAIHSLPPQCRAIFLLNREGGLKYKEIAEQLNISIKTVETHMGRALKHLRSELIPESVSS